MEDYKLPESFRAGQSAFFLMNVQAYTGIRFDERKGLSLLVKLHKEMLQLKEDVEPQLPPRKMKKGEEKEYTLPAKPFKKDGSFSSHMENFIAKHNLVVVDNQIFFEGKTVDVVGGTVLEKKVPMLISNGDDLKDWFLSLGWVPTMWNFKKDSKGKPVRDEKTKEYIVTSPKIQDKGKICPNLVGLDKGDLCSKVVRWLSLRNRYAVLKGWLENERLAIDGRLSSGSSGITPTHRQKHSVVANIPKAEEGVLYGKEFRSLFISDNDEHVCVGYDASALEGRVEGHYTTPYDGGERANILLNGDIHSKNAKLFFPKETELFDPSHPDFNKDDKQFKPYRSRSKNGAYALAYGCTPKKLAVTLGVPEEFGKEKYDAFWEGNPGLRLFKEKVEEYWQHKGQKKYLIAIDRRRLSSRSKHSLVNLLFQSCGAIAMDYSGLYMDRWLGGIKYTNEEGWHYNYKGFIVRRVVYMHDEYMWSCREELSKEIGELGVKSIVEAGRYLKLRVPLDGEAKIGKSWAEVH